MKKIVLFGLVFLIIGSGLWLGRTPYRNWKQKRFLAEAETFLEKSDYRNAVLSARKTLEINPANVEACRIMAGITEQFGFSEAIFWRNRILSLEPNVVRNHLDLARSAILIGDYGEADQALREIKESDRNQAEFHEIAALLDAAEQNIPAAEAQAAAAAKLEPQNKSIRFNLAILDVQSRNKQLIAAAKKDLEALSTDPAFRRDALRQLALAALRDGDFAKSEAFCQQLQLEKPLLFEDQLFNLAILNETKSPNFAGGLTSLQKEVANNPQQINALSEWLTGRQMTGEAIQWLASLPAKTRSEQPVIVAMADCYAARHDWARMQSLLADRHWEELDFLRLALLARAYRGQQDDLNAQVNWHTALTSASGHQQPLATLVRLADAWGWDREKEEAAWLLIERFPGERWALQLLERLYAANGDTLGLQKVYATRMQNDGSDMVAKNNFAAVSLLLGLRLPEAHQIAREDYARFPQDAIITSTYAYSLYLQGRPQDGLKLLEMLPKKKLRLPAVATYYGVLLAGTGQPGKAEAYLEIAGQSHLLPEEKALVAAARTATASPSRSSSKN